MRTLKIDDPGLRWYKPHRLHLWLDCGYPRWRFECIDVEACDCHTCDEDGDPMSPYECWITEQMPEFLDDWCFEEVMDSLTLEPLRSPLLVELALPGIGPGSGPDHVFIREIDAAAVPEEEKPA